MIRHLITSEYPPQLGGVSDYTQLVATGLAAAGDEIHVWCPSLGDVATEAASDEIAAAAGVFVQRELRRIAPADLRRVGKLLDRFARPRRLLVQWVPHGYGYKSMNLPFCFWLWQRARLKRDRIELMVHEPFLAFGEGSKKQDLAAAVHRLMIAALLNAASRVWVSVPEWETLLQPFALGRKLAFDWLPVPSNISVVDDPVGIANVRSQFSLSGGPLAGHFGAYDQYLSEQMLQLLPRLLTNLRQLSMLLVGKGSLELRGRVIREHPDLTGQVHATGTLSSENISRHISACDLMLQPYQDGVSGRRTSVMTALSHGVPVVTTMGKATESIWAESKSVVLVKVGNINALVAATKSLLADDEQRRSMGNLAARLYRDRFDLQHTVSALRGS